MQKIYLNLNKKLGQAVSTLSKIEAKGFGEIVTEAHTRNFLIVHFGQGTESDYVNLSLLLSKMGLEKSSYVLDIYPGYPHAFLETAGDSDSLKVNSYLASQHARLAEENAKEGSQEKPDPKATERPHLNQTITADTHPSLRKGIFCDFDGKERVVFFFNTVFSKSELNCCSNNANLLPMATTNYKSLEKLGLIVIENVVTPDQELVLNDLIFSGKWEPLLHRRVQHFGYRFIYGPNTINPEKKTQPIPDEFKWPFHHPRFREAAARCSVKPSEEFSPDYFDQVTVNEYKPGAGIAPHIDSHSPFEEMLVSVSLISDIVMCFTHAETGEEVNVLLPARSALVLVGEARYNWKHSISDRKIDKLPTGPLFRKHRVSITYRRSRKTKFCSCAFPKVCDYQKGPLPVDDVIQGLDDYDFEKAYVQNVYDAIGAHFDHTRYKPWPLVEQFLNSLEPGSLVGDFGCGNGKYMICSPHLQFIGLDNATSLAEIAFRKGASFQVMIADAGRVPLADSCLDHAISIAVIHHFKKPERRKLAIEELIRTVRPGGRILIYVWAFEQEDGRFAAQDNFVPWNNQKRFEKPENAKVVDKQVNETKQTVVYKRFYHVFKERELEGLVEEIRAEGRWNIHLVRSYFDHENWCVELLRLS